jgi:hypothetical protein
MRTRTEAFRAGAAGYLVKHSAGEELINAIHEVLSGRFYLSPLITRDVLTNLESKPARSPGRLTPRQRDVLQLVVEGKRMKEIAAGRIWWPPQRRQRLLGCVNPGGVIRVSLSPCLVFLRLRACG